MESQGPSGALALPSQQGRPSRRIAACYAVAAVLLLALGVSLVLRQRGQTWAWLDNWGVDALEVTLACLCLGRAAVRGPGRWLALPFGLGLLGWALGDVVWPWNRLAAPRLRHLQRPTSSTWLSIPSPIWP